MVKSVVTTTITKRQIIGRKALIFGATIVGGIISILTAAKINPELTEVLIVEEIEETTIELPDEESKSK